MANNTVFDNKIIEAKAKNLLATSLNTKNLMTVDTTLQESAGMVKTINTYTYTGTADEVAEGQGNTHRGTIAYEGHDYRVKMVQQAFDYKDEDFLKDNTIVDNMLVGANQVMQNKMTADFMAEVAKASLKYEFKHGTKVSYEAIVEAIAKLNIENEEGLFVVLPNAWKAAIRLDADYKAARMGEVVYTGQTGTIAGLPVIFTKAATKEGYVMNKEAVKLFIKKDLEVEQDRDKDKRINSVYERTAYLVALVDATKVCKIAEAAA